MTREEKRHSLRSNKILEEDDLVCYGVEKEDIRVVLCRKEKQVVFVRYYDGTASLDEIIKAVVEKLDQGQIKLEQGQKDLSTVEIVTASNYADIAKLKSVK